MVKAFLASVSSGLGAKPVGETSAKYEAEELEALPAVVVVWGTYQRFEGNFDCIDRFLDA